MNRLGIEPLHVGGLIGEVLDADETVTVVLRGDSDARDAGAALDEYLVRRIHKAVSESKIKKIQLDVTGLEFLNSSGIKALVNWLIAVKLQKPEDRYFIVLQYDEGITWQSKGLKPLACVAPSLLRLEPLR